MTPEEQVIGALKGIGATVVDEAELSALVSRRFSDAGVQFAAEVELSKADRIDFLVEDVGVELKVQGSPASVIRQLDRYAGSDRVRGLLLVTTSRRLARAMPKDLRGKRVLTITMGAL